LGGPDSSRGDLGAAEWERVDSQTAQFIERMGMLTEEDGLPRIAGRIFAYLLVTPEECSLDDIATALGVSRASVSTDARRLAQMGLVERRGRPGDRRDYYSIGAASARSWFDRRLRGMQRFNALMSEAEALPVGNAAVRARIAHWAQLHREMLVVLTDFLARLDARTPGTGRAVPAASQSTSGG
jgi:DNA-binding MarR family transcriptional regulator